MKADLKFDRSKISWISYIKTRNQWKWNFQYTVRVVDQKAITKSMGRHESENASWNRRNGQKISETRLKFFLHLSEFKLGMNAFRIKSYDFFTTSKIDSLILRSRARECFLHTCLPYDHCYLFHFSWQFSAKRVAYSLWVFCQRIIIYVETN